MVNIVALSIQKIWQRVCFKSARKIRRRLTNLEIQESIRKVFKTKPTTCINPLVHIREIVSRPAPPGIISSDSAEMVSLFHTLSHQSEKRRDGSSRPTLASWHKSSGKIYDCERALFSSRRSSIYYAKLRRIWKILFNLCSGRKDEKSPSTNGMTVFRGFLSFFFDFYLQTSSFDYFLDLLAHFHYAD